MSTLTIPPSASSVGLSAAPVLPPVDPPVSFAEVARISVDQYQRMIASGVLGPDDRVELLDGILVTKMSKGPEHVYAGQLVADALKRLALAGWFVRTQGPIALDTCVPEPDVSLVRGTARDYRARHPQAAEVALVVEVAESSLSRDQNWKKVIYARNGIPAYWVVNLVERTVEVYADPTGPIPEPDYRQRTVRTATDTLEIVVAGNVVGSIPVSIPVSELLPDLA